MGRLAQSMTDSTVFISLPFLGACFGYLIARFLLQRQPQFQSLLLAFSGAFLLAVVFFELLPEIYSNADFTPGYWIIVGIILQIGLEFFSKGVEHGHTHSHNHQQFPLLILLSLGIHAFLEGLPLDAHPSLAIGMFIHKVPIAISLYSLLNQYTISTFNRFGALLGFALLTPLGGILGKNILLNEETFGIITALVIGLLLHIATTILFESNEGHRLKSNKFLSILLGFLIGSLL